jgi:hypothetical protein
MDLPRNEKGDFTTRCPIVFLQDNLTAANSSHESFASRLDLSQRRVSKKNDISPKSNFLGNNKKKKQNLPASESVKIS